MLSLHGIGVSRGCVIGNIALLERDMPEVVEYALNEQQIGAEITRFQSSVAIAEQQLRAIRERIPASASADISGFIDSHILMLEDALLSKAPIEIIQQRRCNAEWALKIQRDRVVEVFDAMDDPYLRTRKDDIDHVVARVQRLLLAQDSAATEVPGSRLEKRIVVTADLTPADIILLQHQGIAAFVTEYGGPLSHTAILARSLEIPAVVGVRNMRRYLIDDETIVVDGEQGVVLAGLDQATLHYYRYKQQLERQHRQALERLKHQAAVTRDKVTIDLHANIELPEDTAAAARVEAAGVGLYRTEFLFMNRSDIPSEEEHLASYLEVLNLLPNRPVTIRTVDLGADKQVDGGRSDTLATNPALGLRGIRLCLREPGLLKPQLRAILRASHSGPVRIMIPMLSSVQEIVQVRQLVEISKQELRAEQIAFAETVPIGGMVEVPAAAVCAPLFAQQLDFLSIGTNDLIQYTLAIDRGDDEVNYLYDPLHPAVLSLLRTTIQAGHDAGIPVSLCGEMAGEPRYTRLLLGLGLQQFSMHPANLLEVKAVINDSEVRDCQRQVRQLLTADAEQFDILLQTLTQQ